MSSSINHFTSEPLWWKEMEPNPKSPPPNFPHLYLHHHPFSAQSPILGFNLNHEQDGHHRQEPAAETEIQILTKKEELDENDDYPDQDLEVSKELMFEKPLTPSDVGKLNRLVIPKQHAEKYFPLGASGGGGDGSEKGLLLSFEDESGKSWRFRYSYWNSSQSYVLTKGWSRFVKEKRLDAGDVVLFERHRTAACGSGGDRLFIGWRRRNAPVGSATGPTVGGGLEVVGGGRVVPAVVGADSSSSSSNSGSRWTRVFYPAHPTGSHSHDHGPLLPYHHHHHQKQSDSPHATGTNVPNQMTPSGNSKRLRLFGVNLECQQQPDDQMSEPSTPEGSSMSSQGQAHSYSMMAHASDHQNHMDMNF